MSRTSRGGHLNASSLFPRHSRWIYVGRGHFQFPGLQMMDNHPLQLSQISFLAGTQFHFTGFSYQFVSDQRMKNCFIRPVPAKSTDKDKTARDLYGKIYVIIDFRLPDPATCFKYTWKVMDANISRVFVYPDMIIIVLNLRSCSEPTHVIERMWEFTSCSHTYKCALFLRTIFMGRNGRKMNYWSEYNNSATILMKNTNNDNNQC